MNSAVYLWLIAVCFSGFEQQVDGARILGLFPFEGRSHFIIFEEVMKALADAGHQVDVLSQFPLEKPYKRYTDIRLVETAPAIMMNGLTYDFIHSFQQSANVMIEFGGNQICQYLNYPATQNLIKNPPNDPPYDLVITEAFYASCWYAFGRHLNVPVVAISAHLILPHANEPIGNPLNTAFVSEINDGSIIHMDFWQRFKNTIWTLKENFQFNYYTEVQSDLVRNSFGPNMPGIREIERDVALLLVNTHHTLSGVKPLTPAVVEIGGMHVRVDGRKMPANLTKWLDDSTHGFVYLSFGSVLRIESFPKSFLDELYSGLAQIAPIRVLMRVLVPEDLPPGLPKNVITLKWVPQSNVLQHKKIRAFVTHGGAMGVQEALTFKVPLVGIPVFADQPLLMKNCLERGIAVLLDYKNFTANKFVAAVDAVTSDPKYKNNVNILSERFLDRPLSPRDTAVFWIEYILKHGSDSLRSPAVNLTWWQLALLDVYGSILIAILITFYLIKLLLCTLLSRFLPANKAVPTSKKKN